jgi:hypothetical protein
MAFRAIRLRGIASGPLSGLGRWNDGAAQILTRGPSRIVDRIETVSGRETMVSKRYRLTLVTWRADTNQHAL